MKLKTFKEWVKLREMAGGDAIVNPKKDCNNPDFQVWGAACNGKKKKAKKT